MMNGLGSLLNVSALFPIWAAQALTSGLFYLGPETIMPLASILATVLGFLLIFWRAIIRFIKRILRIAPKESEEALVQTADDDEQEINL
jgi:hypothetical protein